MLTVRRVRWGSPIRTQFTLSVVLIFALHFAETTPTMWFKNRISLLSSLFLALPFSSAFYLPGVTPTSYDEGQAVPLYVNHITPGIAGHDEQLHSVLSYDYYYPAFRFCRPKDGPQDVRESLGSILFGDRIQSSPFE